jgi:hypothetical protein
MSGSDAEMSPLLRAKRARNLAAKSSDADTHAAWIAIAKMWEAQAAIQNQPTVSAEREPSSSDGQG